MIYGVSHITFVVADLDRTERLFIEALGARKVYDSASDGMSLSPERFYVFDGIGAGFHVVTMLGTPTCKRSFDHLSLAVHRQDLDVYRERLLALGVDVKDCESRDEAEGRSLFFHDFDNHMIELNAGTLDHRLDSGRAVEK